MKSILVSLLMATAAPAATTIINHFEKGVTTTVTLEEPGRYLYEYSFVKDSVFHFDLAVYFQFGDRPPVLRDLQGASRDYWIEGQLSFSSLLEGGNIELISFETDTAPVLTTVYQSYKVDGINRINMQEGYAPAPIPEPAALFLFTLSSLALFRRCR